MMLHDGVFRPIKGPTKLLKVRSGAHTMSGKAVRSVRTILFVAAMLAPLLAGAQGTAEIQKGLPPDPNATSPEYARPHPAPERPALEPTPGKPALDPKSGGAAEARRSTGLVHWAFMRLWPILILGVGAALLVLAAARVRRRTGPL
jgi:hypothetical protein